LFDKYKKLHINYDEIMESNFIYNEPFLLCIEWDSVVFEFFVRLKENSEGLLVLGSGAYDSSTMKPPVFQRHSWIEHFGDDSVIYYNDPTLYLGKINIGWGQGTIDRFYLKDLATILSKILAKTNIDNENVLFYGSSAGGFMSLILAGLVRGAIALVNNPQIIVTNFFQSHVDALFQASYPELTVSDITTKYKSRLNILEFYKDIQYYPEIYYLQNVACVHDIDNQLNPFINGLKSIQNGPLIHKFHLELYFNEQQGHNPLGLEETLQYINKVKPF
jgi:hypothetical protein